MGDLSSDKKLELLVSKVEIAGELFKLTGRIVLCMGTLVVLLSGYFVMEIRSEAKANRVSISQNKENIAVLNAGQTSILKWREQVNIKLEKTRYNK